MHEALIKELDERITKAQDAIVNQGKVLSDNNAERREIDANIVKVHTELSKPENAIPKPPPPTADGKPGKPVDPPAPPAPLPEPATATSPEVQELTQRRLALVDDMRSVSAALQQLHNMLDKQSMLSISFRQPFVNDTGNISQVIGLLKLPEEQAQAIAQRRLGLNPYS
jgi:hypothetical protein